jgi:hypothetical protein
MEIINQDLDKTKATGANQVALKSTAQKPNDKPLPKKWQRVLTAFVEGKSFNRFESERQLNDHCLHTTVSTLQGFGVTIFREFETVPGWQGIPTRVCRYWLDRSEPNIKRANQLLKRSYQTEEAI